MEKGRSHSIHLGLQEVPPGSACFIHNIDNPFPAVSLLRLLLKSLPHKGYAVPVFQGRGGHPVLLGPGMADLLRIQSELTDFRQILRGFDRVEVPSPDDQILWNINTPEEYRKFLKAGKSSTG